MKTILISLICLINSCISYELEAMPQQEIILKNSATSAKISKKKIRWKQVFRPIKVFKKKIRWWMLWALGGAALMSLIFLVADINGDAEGDIFYFFAGVFILSAITFVLCLIAIPIIIIVRIFQELAWRKRYQRCFN